MRSSSRHDLSACVLLACAALCAPVLGAEPTPAAKLEVGPPKQIMKTDLSDLLVKRVRDATAVIETRGGGLRLVKAGVLLGSQNDKVISVEQDRIMLAGERLVAGQELRSTVILTWDAEGKVKEQRMETPLRESTEKRPPLARTSTGKTTTVRTTSKSKEK